MYRLIVKYKKARCTSWERAKRLVIYRVGVMDDRSFSAVQLRFHDAHVLRLMTCCFTLTIFSYCFLLYTFMLQQDHESVNQRLLEYFQHCRIYWAHTHRKGLHKESTPNWYGQNCWCLNTRRRSRRLAKLKYWMEKMQLACV